jgi:hypothetical protein
VQHLRKNGFEGRIIVMSGSLTPELIKAYKAKRIHKILQKPFTASVLIHELKGLFEHWKTERGNDDKC